MRIDRLHPLSRDVEVFLNGEQLLNCLWADDVENKAEVELADENGEPLWDEDREFPLTQIRLGDVRFKPRQGFEERFGWFLIGWVAGRDETLEKLKRGVSDA